MTRQREFEKRARNKKATLLEQQLYTALAEIKRKGFEKIAEQLHVVNSPDYLIEKQRLLDQLAEENGTRPKRARIDEYEFLRVMTEEDLTAVLVAHLPIVCLEDKI